ncbi:glycoprotein endo-alpha-1,2-mannosidase [Sarotherodon galilaeus]
MGLEQKLIIGFNATFVHPGRFYLGGFSDMAHDNYYYVFLCFVYIFTVVGNVLLILIIFLIKTLHTPKYMIVFSLALTDLCGSTALIPKLLDTFLFDRRYILYEACLSYMFFVLFFASIQSWTLVIMAYVRFIAIWFPLRYHSIVTKTSIAAMLTFEWLLITTIVASTVGLIDRLSFCGSFVVKSFFCDHGPVFYLAWNDTSLNRIMAYVALVSFICIPLILIAFTYERNVILVAIFFLPLVGTNIAAVASYVHPNARIINSTLTYTIPALLNPIIYALKTEEVMNAVKKLWKKKTFINTA